MILTCPACGTRYNLKKPIEAPKKVRCAKCAHSWTQEPILEEPEEVVEEPVVDEPDPEPDPEPVHEEPETDVEEEPAFEHRGPSAASIDAALPVEDFHSFRGGLSIDRIASGLLMVIVFVGLIAFAVQMRTQISRVWPAAAGFYYHLGIPVNITGIEIVDPAWSVETRDGAPALTVTGGLLNTVNKDKAVPRLRFAVLDKNGIELYVWTIVPTIQRLDGGERSQFSTELPNPPEDAHNIEIRFAIDGT